MSDMTIDEWIKYGISKGYCTDVTCVTHIGVANTKEEEQEWDAGFDPCIPGMRVWLDSNHQQPLELEDFFLELDS